MVAGDLSLDNDASRVLLVGDVSEAFLDADVVEKLGCQIEADMLDAIEAAAKQDFGAIGVVLSGCSGKLSSALKALKQANAKARIVLLAQMYEEPLAIQLVGGGEGRVADDYMICPIEVRRFREVLIGGQDNRAVEGGGRFGSDGRVEARIKKLEELATTDELTGLKNRRYILEFTRQIIEHARKEDGRVTLLVFDIDNFKHYNDVYGHSAGDEILKEAAVLMRRCCRPHDVVGRFGGDEFSVVFWDDPVQKSADSKQERRLAIGEHPNEVIFIAKRFREELGKTELHLLGPEGKGVLTISGGLASFPRDGSTGHELFELADKALLDAKRSGKNRIYLVGKSDNDIGEIE